MPIETIPGKKVHHGRNIKRIREILHIKQDTLAFDLNMSQQNVSVLESKEEIEDDLLKQIAGALKIQVEAIKNFDEQSAINIITTAFTSHDNSFVNNCTFNINPIEKVVRSFRRE